MNLLQDTLRGLESFLHALHCSPLLTTEVLFFNENKISFELKPFLTQSKECDEHFVEHENVNENVLLSVEKTKVSEI